MVDSEDSLLFKIGSQLQENPEINTWRVDYLPLRPYRYNLSLRSEVLHEVDFLVAPKKPIAPDDVTALNELMDSLVQGEPLKRKPFTCKFAKDSQDDSVDRGYLGFGLHLGWLAFMEILGTKTTDVTLDIITSEEKLFTRPGLSIDVPKVETLDYIRDIRIRPYPNSRIAKFQATFEEDKAEGRVIEVRKFGNKYRRLRSRLTESEVHQLKNGKNPFVPSQFRNEAELLTEPTEEAMGQITSAQSLEDYLVIIRKFNSAQRQWALDEGGLVRDALRRTQRSKEEVDKLIGYLAALSDFRVSSGSDA